MAIKNGRILRVGNYSFVQQLAGDATEQLNLQGKVVVPGFIDSHVHLINGGLQVYPAKPPTSNSFCHLLFWSYYCFIY